MSLLVLLSIFKRKGGEGVFTKIVNSENYNHYKNLFKWPSNSQETPLIVYFLDNSNWFFLTDNKISFTYNDCIVEIYHNEISDVRIAIEEEFRRREFDKSKFTIIEIKDKNLNKYLVSIERGLPFQGLYQVLHFIAGSQ